MSRPDDLRSLTLFAGCSEPELVHAASLLTTIDASPGRVLMTQGHGACQFVIVADGHIEVVHHHDGSPDLRVTLGPDSHVGEVGLLDHIPCTATVRTEAGARLHVAGTREFRELAGILSVACNLRSVADDRMAENELVDSLF